jgi:hypothetical protein
MIAYKVVEKKTRHGSNWMLINLYGEKHRLTAKYKKYFPKYNVGATVKSIPDSVGILCFKEKHNAMGFIGSYGLEEHAKVVRVDGEGKITSNPMIFGGCGTYPKTIVECFEDNADRARYFAPCGSIGFEYVTVLE